MSGSIWAAFALAVVASPLLGAVMQTALNRRKTRVDIQRTQAETDQTIAQTALSMVERLEQEVEDLRDELADEKARARQVEDVLRGEISNLRKDRNDMLGFIHEAGLDWPRPPYT